MGALQGGIEVAEQSLGYKVVPTAQSEAMA
jgi:hypothetical protein